MIQYLNLLETKMDTSLLFSSTINLYNKRGGNKK